MADEPKKTTLDVNAVAQRARQIALENAKANPALVVGPEASWIAATIDFLAIREALMEVEIDPVTRIFNKLHDEIDRKAAGGEEKSV